MADAFKNLIHRPVVPVPTSGIILELFLWWIYRARLFATRPPLSSRNTIDFSDILGPTPPEWVLPLSAVVALVTGLTITVRVLRNGRNRIGTWHWGKLVVIAAVAVAVGRLTWSLLNSLTSMSPETLSASITIGFLAALLASAVIVPLTGIWLWLSARESR